MSFYITVYVCGADFPIRAQRRSGAGLLKNRLGHKPLRLRLCGALRIVAWHLTQRAGVSIGADIAINQERRQCPYAGGQLLATDTLFAVALGWPLLFQLKRRLMPSVQTALLIFFTAATGAGVISSSFWLTAQQRLAGWLTLL